MHRPNPALHAPQPLRLPSGPSGPLRSGAHLVAGSGRLPTLATTRNALLQRRGGAPYARSVRVFAVEPHEIQLDWAALGPGTVRVRAADTTVEFVATGGPGAVVVTGLPSNTSVAIRLDGSGVPEPGIVLTGRTPAPPPGAEIARIATISDLHVGETTFGYLQLIGESPSLRPEQTHPIRCASDAIGAATAWGAQHLIVKGDVVDQSHPGHWREAIRLLDTVPFPVHVVPGNHETKSLRTIEAADALASTSIEFVNGVGSIDLNGATVALVGSAVANEERGNLSSVHNDLVDLLGDVSGGALVAMHHHLRHNRTPSGWPVGVPVDEALRTVDAIIAVHPSTMVTSGHVHRNRLWRRGPVTLTTVGSVKDYPGVWAGYVFYEGGIRQVVRRVAGPSTITWTERTGDALGGLYRHWTPGRLDQRSVTITWP